MRIREDISANYKSIFFNGKTVRMRLNSSLPITVPSYPEIEDVAINSKCFANCSYCYTSATKDGSNFDQVVEKAHLVWGSLPENQRPFQIAIGGAGESTIHPDWVEFVTEVKGLGIMPNYTTNGMHLSEKILQVTNDICGGVAVSYHPHIRLTFDKALNQLKDLNSKLNIHVILGDQKSLEDLKSLYHQYAEILDYIVVLPYQAVGRAKEIETHQVWKDTFDFISTVDSSKFAFGALFYDYISNNHVPLKMSIYEPEIYSGYRMMDDSFDILRKSSYDLRPKNNLIDSLV